MRTETHCNYLDTVVNAIIGWSFLIWFSLLNGWSYIVTASLVLAQLCCTRSQSNCVRNTSISDHLDYTYFTVIKELLIMLIRSNIMMVRQTVFSCTSVIIGHIKSLTNKSCKKKITNLYARIGCRRTGITEEIGCLGLFFKQPTQWRSE